MVFLPTSLPVESNQADGMCNVATQGLAIKRCRQNQWSVFRRNDIRMEDSSSGRRPSVGGGRLPVTCFNLARQSATRGKVTCDAGPDRTAGVDDILQNTIHCILVKDP